MCTEFHVQKDWNFFINIELVIPSSKLDPRCKLLQQRIRSTTEQEQIPADSLFCFYQLMFQIQVLVDQRRTVGLLPLPLLSRRVLHPPHTHGNTLHPKDGILNKRPMIKF